MESSQAVPMAAALNWVIKDGLGQFGGVIFASYVGTVKAFDRDPKRWRQISAIATDASTLLEVLSPLFPGYFIPVASIANVGKNISYLSASASRAALHNSLATRGNLADVTAKAGSQAILAGMLGTGLGVALVPIFGGQGVGMVAAGFCGLTIGHQYCTFKSLSSATIKSLNSQRLHHILSDYIRGKGGGAILSPQEVGEREVFVPGLPVRDISDICYAGCGLEDVSSGGIDNFFMRRACLGGEEKYILRYDMEGERAYVAYLEGATGLDLIRGVYHAYLAEIACQTIISVSGSSIRRRGETVVDDEKAILGQSYERLKLEFPAFQEKIEKDGRWMVDSDNVSVESSKSVRLQIL